MNVHNIIMLLSISSISTMSLCMNFPDNEKNETEQHKTVFVDKMDLFLIKQYQDAATKAFQEGTPIPTGTPMLLATPEAARLVSQYKNLLRDHQRQLEGYNRRLENYELEVTNQNK